MAQAENSLRSQPFSPMSIEAMVDCVSHWLPAQGPLETFVHHNTLHSYQDLKFEEAVFRAAKMTGANPTLSRVLLKKKFERGEISERAIRIAIRELGISADLSSSLRSEMMDYLDAKDEPIEVRFQDGLRVNGYRSRWKTQLAVDPNQLIHPKLFRWFGLYLDQGISSLQFQDSNGLLSSLRTLVDQSVFPISFLSSPESRKLLAQRPDEIISFCLETIVGERQHWLRYIAELCLAHPGWSGLIHYIEHHPACVRSSVRVHLIESIAVELIAELALYRSRDQLHFGEPLVKPSEPALPIPAFEPHVFSKDDRLGLLWQSAFEWTYLDPLLRKVLSSQNPERTKSIRDQPRAQALFCIDDRECSFRRHIETRFPSVETFGVAGFFGVDCQFQDAGRIRPQQHCPVPVRPKHLIRDISSHSGTSADRIDAMAHSSQAHRLLREWAQTLVLGWAAFFKIIGQVFGFSEAPPPGSSLRKLSPASQLIWIYDETRKENREEDSTSWSTLQLGYSVSEMTDRVASVLKSAGFQHFSEIVVVFGHGASTVNNPYFSAYECGACSGRSGAANARVFASMANLPEVRALLKTRGIVIPAETRFVGAIHDTTRDEVVYFPDDDLHNSTVERLTEFQAAVALALEDNAKERLMKIPRPAASGRSGSPLDEVRRRSVALFEPRPELNHATNAACFVGPRHWTRGKNLNRRVFLHSYEDDLDSDGQILSGILNAVVPVCGGINLEYFFSSMDASVYGAGSKLSHNLVGLVGVANGVDGDLLTGLPTQMTELHEPVRLSVLVVTSPEKLNRLIQSQPALRQWVHNQWIRAFAIDPITSAIFEIRDSGYFRIDDEERVRWN